MPNRVTAPAAPDPIAPFRRLLLLLVLVGAGGLLLELLLLEHWDSRWQWTPLALLGIVLLLGASTVRRATRPLLRALRLVFALCVAAGALGVWLHMDENLAFEREMNPDVGGSAMLREAVLGATPLLAPGALLHLGLVGLLFAYRHPALRRPPADAHRPSPSA